MIKLSIEDYSWHAKEINGHDLALVDGAHAAACEEMATTMSSVEAAAYKGLQQCIETVMAEGEEEQKHIGKIVEFFQTTDRKNYLWVQWFYRIQDTVVKDAGDYHDKRRLFYSSIMNDNLIDSIIEKVNVRYIKHKNWDLVAQLVYDCVYALYAELG
ncbi:unnamed protein product [Lathyrus sativus]|nr:unnamed protein product [Lathyrus sativus]